MASSPRPHWAPTSHVMPHLLLLDCQCCCMLFHVCPVADHQAACGGSLHATPSRPPTPAALLLAAGSLQQYTRPVVDISQGQQQQQWPFWPASAAQQAPLSCFYLAWSWCWGPELRAVFPVVLNVGVAGRVMLSGNPTVPGGLLPSGTIRLEGGVLNLVATQFRLDRDSPNTITFSPDTGLDPLLDVALSSSELRVSITGRGSAWQDHLSLTATGAAAAGGGSAAGVAAAGAVAGSGAAGVGAGGSGGREAGVMGLEGIAGDPLSGRAVARAFEGAAGRVHPGRRWQPQPGHPGRKHAGVAAPKIETQGQLGKARSGATCRAWHCTGSGCGVECWPGSSCFAARCICITWHPAGNVMTAMMPAMSAVALLAHDCTASLRGRTTSSHSGLSSGHTLVSCWALLPACCTGSPHRATS